MPKKIKQKDSQILSKALESAKDNIELQNFFNNMPEIHPEIFYGARWISFFFILNNDITGFLRLILREPEYCKIFIQNQKFPDTKKDDQNHHFLKLISYCIKINKYTTSLGT